MNTPSRIKILTTGLLMSGWWLNATIGFGQQVNWTNPGVGNWNTGGNWDSSFGQPDAFVDEFGVISNGGTAFLASPASADTAGIILGLGSSEFGALELRSGGSLISRPGSFAGAGGPVEVGQTGTGMLTVFRGGSLTAYALSVGGNSASSLILGETGGTGTSMLSVNTASNLNRLARIIGPNVAFTTDSLTFGSESTFVAEITGTTHSAISVANAATLNGILQVEFSGYVPTVGESWDLVTATTLSGDFASVDSSAVGSLPPGVGLFVEQAGGVARLVAEARLVLVVDRRTGATRIENIAAGSITFDGYEVASAGGNLSSTGWTSLQSQATPGWLEIGAPTNNLLAELNPFGSSTLANNDSFDLGQAYGFTPTAFGESGEDVAFQYSLEAGSVVDGVVQYEGPHNNLVLVVNPDTGEGALQNQSIFEIELDGYEVRSANGSLNAAGWESLADNPDQAGWFEIGSPTANLLAELNPLGTTTLSSGDVLALGNLFSTAGTRDLTLEFSLDPDAVFTGIVEYGEITVPPLFEADFDEDGDVDGDDFLAWQGGFGTSSGAQKSDGDYDNDGDVDGDDFLGWQDEFGSSIGDGAAAVPEPTTITMLLIGLLLTFGRCRRCR